MINVLIYISFTKLIILTYNSQTVRRSCNVTVQQHN